MAAFQQKILPIILLLVLLGFDTTYSIPHSGVDEWETWKIEHGKSYSTEEEEEHRFHIYNKNKDKVEAHNLAALRGETTYFMKMNHFSDARIDELSKRMNRAKVDLSDVIQGGVKYVSPSHAELPERVDWRREGAVTPVKNQGECGSCWAFSVTGALEGQHFRKTGELVSLSEQNLVDCSKNGGDDGCHGGYESSAFKYIQMNGGIDTEETYPYYGACTELSPTAPHPCVNETSSAKCSYDPSHIGATVEGYNKVESGNEDALKSAVATVGPISVSIFVAEDFFRYSHGVYTTEDCRDHAIGLHAVLIAGYEQNIPVHGSDKKYDTWIVKNSWGEEWGDHGYIHMARNDGNICEIANDALFPIV